MTDAPASGTDRPAPRMTSRIEPALLAALGAAQGLALWQVHERWPAEQVEPLLVAAIWAVVASGLVLHLARTGAQRLRLVLLASAVGLAFGAVAWWVAAQLPETTSQAAGDASRVWTWSLASWVALFVLGPFVQIQQATRRWTFPYAELYRLSWRNFFVVVLGAAVTAVLWVVLALWGALFDLIGIEFFRQLFTGEPAFAYPATGAAFAYGLCVARERLAILDALVVITQALFRALLALVATVSLVFLASLPVTGLAPLFGTNSASALLIAWLAVGILLFNAVYLDGARPPLQGVWLRRLAEAGALAMPALGTLALYALGLRIAQYGLTPERCWAVAAAAVLSCYGFGYAYAVLRRGEPWLLAVRSVNVAMALVVIALAFALHTPLGDPLDISLRNQLARLEDGRASWEEFDFRALRFQLGERGLTALRRLGQRAPTGAARERVVFALETKSPWEEERPVESTFALLPPGRA